MSYLDTFLSHNGLIVVITPKGSRFITINCRGYSKETSSPLFSGYTFTRLQLLFLSSGYLF